MSFWQSLRIGASGLLAQRLRLDVIANNIANAQTTRTQNGGPYQRQDVVFKIARLFCVHECGDAERGGGR